jgi:branched-chain amino acid transport system substrate-binding protein
MAQKASRRRFLKYAGTAIVAGAVAAVGGYYASVATPKQQTTTTAALKIGKLIIGHVTSLTGTFSSFGPMHVAGARLAVNEINAAGGFVVGDTKYTIDYIVRDDESTPSTALTKVNELVTKYDTKICFGPGLSASALATEPYTEEHHIINAPFVANYKVTQSNPKYVFNLYPQGWMAKQALDYPVLKHLIDQKGVSKIAIIQQSGATMEGSVVNLKQAMDAAGGCAIVYNQIYDPDRTDFRSIILAAKGTNPDAVFLPMNPDKTSLVKEQMYELKWQPITFGDGYEAVAPQWPPKNPPEAALNHFTLGLGEDSYNLGPYMQAAYAAYSKANDVVALPWNQSAASNYDAMKMLVEAIQDAGTVTDTDKISASMHRLKHMGALYRPMSFQPCGALYAQIVVVEQIGGGPRDVTYVSFWRLQDDLTWGRYTPDWFKT